MTEAVRVADRETRLRSLGHAALVVLGAFALGLLFGLAAVQALASLGYTPAADPLPVLVVSTVFQFAGFYAAVYWYFQRLGDFEALVHWRRPALPDVAWVIGGVVVLLGTNYLLSELLVSAGLEGAQNAIVQLGREEPALFLYLIPVTILFVAPAEELVFRGAVQGLFRRAWGVVPAIVLASAFFAVAHYLALAGEGSRLVTLGVIFALGGVLATVYELSDSLLVSAAVHACWNVVLFAWEYAAATGLV